VAVGVWGAVRQHRVSDRVATVMSFVTLSTPVFLLAVLIKLGAIQINDSVGRTFAATLRSFLRQDPDVIMVGEMRDTETAQISVRAALTGHLVLTSLHAPSAPAAFARLRDIGVEDGLLASAVTCVIAQRLVRRLCPDCRQAYYPSVDEFAALGVEARLGLRFHRARGCGSCAGTGYVGRQGLYEVVEVDDAIRACIGLGPSELARVAGMRSLHAAGVALVVDGVTSVDELARVAGDRLA
jgi:type II secretory ATPase GspE/PulE/Tfp pilus assembly ATPase PilB-like protein